MLHEPVARGREKKEKRGDLKPYLFFRRRPNNRRKMNKEMGTGGGEGGSSFSFAICPFPVVGGGGKEKKGKEKVYKNCPC